MIRIPCKHWKDCGINGGGCCKINEYNRPAFAVCLSFCTKYNGPDQTELKKQIMQLTPNKKPLKRKKTCNKGEIRSWMRIRWYGLPSPVRVWRKYMWASHPPINDWPGCGCIVKFKVAWDGFKWWMKIVKQA